MNKPLTFWKMQGAGNDFIVIDNRPLGLSIDQLAELAVVLCKRRFGVGADGLMALNTTTLKGSEYEMVYRNADGSDAGMCGNGGRCMAMFAYGHGFGTTQRFNVHRNLYEATVRGKEVHLKFTINTRVEELEIGLEKFYQVHTATEHLVYMARERDLNDTEFLIEAGSTLRHHERFAPKGTNVNFVYGKADDLIKLQTYERGVEDLTLACGTGAMASALAWHHKNQKESRENEISVECSGGTLKVGFIFDKFRKAYFDLTLTGPAVRVFTGIAAI